MTRGAPIPETVTLHVPFRVVKRGGRKEMQLPDGATQPRRTDSTLVKALARAFRWKRMLESGEFATIAELAEREGIAPSYMTRVLRLTLLAPDIVEAILDGKQGPGRYEPIVKARLQKIYNEAPANNIPLRSFFLFHHDLGRHGAGNVVRWGENIFRVDCPSVTGLVDRKKACPKAAAVERGRSEHQNRTFKRRHPATKTRNGQGDPSDDL